MLVGSYLIDLDLLQRMLMDLSENETFKIGEWFSFQNYARLNIPKIIIYRYYFIEVITVTCRPILLLYIIIKRLSNYRSNVLKEQ